VKVILESRTALIGAAAYAEARAGAERHSRAPQRQVLAEIRASV